MNGPVVPVPNGSVGLVPNGPVVPVPPLRPGRPIVGMSAVLLPFGTDGSVDWVGFEAHLARTVAAGLVPALNMDTGFGPVLDPSDRARVLALGAALAPGERLAGVHVADGPGAPFDADAYRIGIETVVASGAVPILFPSHGLAGLPESEIAAAHATVLRDCDRAYGFELGAMFHPAGRIYSIETFRALLEIPQLVGAKHSSLQRGPEWERLAVRDALRPDFRVLTGNDLAIDMVMWGSDYLLGLSTFAPDAFAVRDAAWRDGDLERFHALDDLLQYLGQFAFRAPVPGYRHDAAMFLTARGHLACDRTHPQSPVRPDADRAILADIAGRLAALLPA